MCAVMWFVCRIGTYLCNMAGIFVEEHMPIMRGIYTDIIASYLHGGTAWLLLRSPQIVLF